MNNKMDRRNFVKLSLAGGVGLSVMSVSDLLGAETNASSTFKIGGDLKVHRLGFGAMRITGDGIWGWPKDREEAKRVLKRVVELGVDLIDTADAFGTQNRELLIAETLHPYPKGLVIATKSGNTPPRPNHCGPTGKPE